MINSSGTSATGLPRMRGDRPLEQARALLDAMFTPHARGSTVASVSRYEVEGVYPACAGIDPLCSLLVCFSSRLPRMRGDRPVFALLHSERERFTPHARGSTVSKQFGSSSAKVYPACAGIDPSSTSGFAGLVSLPRMRGDRPLR